MMLLKAPCGFARYFRKEPLVSYKLEIVLLKESCLRLLLCYSRLNFASNGTKQDNVQINSRLNLNSIIYLIIYLIVLIYPVSQTVL